MWLTAGPCVVVIPGVITSDAAPNCGPEVGILSMLCDVPGGGEMPCVGQG